MLLKNVKLSFYMTGDISSFTRKELVRDSFSVGVHRLSPPAIPCLALISVLVSCSYSSFCPTLSVFLCIFFWVCPTFLLLHACLSLILLTQLHTATFPLPEPVHKEPRNAPLQLIGWCSVWCGVLSYGCTGGQP